MKSSTLFATILFLVSCSETNKVINSDKYIIETYVQLQKGKTNEVLELFKLTNSELVKNESDWIKATFSSIEDKDVVIVRAEWKSKESYLKFSNSDKFKETMAQFGKYFSGKPSITITKVLYEM